MPLLGSANLEGACTIKIGKCAECRKRFSYTNYHRYVRNDGGKKIYCSYTCFRAKAKEHEAKERERFLKSCEQVELREARAREYLKRRRHRKVGQAEFEKLADAQEAVEYSRGKMTEYEEKLLAAEPGTIERSRARKNLTYWEKEHLRLKGVAEEMKRGGK